MNFNNSSFKFLIFTSCEKIRITILKIKKLLIYKKYPEYKLHIMQIRLEDIKIPPRIRNRNVDVDDLVNSFNLLGQLQPIILNHNYDLIAGYRRYKAAKRLGWETIEAKIIDVADKHKRLLIEIHENQDRMNFSADELEKAKKLMKRYNNKNLLVRLWVDFIEFIQKLFRWWG